MRGKGGEMKGSQKWEAVQRGPRPGQDAPQVFAGFSYSDRNRQGDPEGTSRVKATPTPITSTAKATALRKAMQEQEENEAMWAALPLPHNASSDSEMEEETGVTRKGRDEGRVVALANSVVGNRSETNRHTDDDAPAHGSTPVSVPEKEATALTTPLAAEPEKRRSKRVSQRPNSPLSKRHNVGEQRDSRPEAPDRC